MGSDLQARAAGGLSGDDAEASQDCYEQLQQHNQALEAAPRKLATRLAQIIGQRQTLRCK
jgi:hypothetical protein